MKPILIGDHFQIEVLKTIEKKWAGSLEVGLTTHNPEILEYPSTMSNLSNGGYTVMFRGKQCLINGTLFSEMQQEASLEYVKVSSVILFP